MKRYNRTINQKGMSLVSVIVASVVGMIVMGINHDASNATNEAKHYLREKIRYN